MKEKEEDEENKIRKFAYREQTLRQSSREQRIQTLRPL